MSNITPRDKIRWATRNHFISFFRKSFEITNPGTKLDLNWHHFAIAHALWRVERGEIKRLLITMPPRSLKSEMVSIAWAAYLLGQNPALRVFMASYGDDLSVLLARRCREVMTSPLYLDAFPGTQLHRTARTDLETTAMGGRYATTVGGVVTGRGGDIIILDDPMKAEDAMSKARREAAWDWFRNTLLSRLDDKRTGAIVVIQQRLHVDDIAGRLIEEGGWEHLCLPAIATKEESISIGPDRVHTRQVGDLLHPEREPLHVLEDLRQKMGSFNFSAQYQQAPIPVEGNLIQPQWFKPYDTLPAGGTIVQSWDFAVEAGATNDFTVCITALVKNRSIHILDVYRRRINYPDQRKAYIDLCLRYRARRVIIEKSANGHALRQDLKNVKVQGLQSPIAVPPRGDKVSRISVHAASLEAGDVFVPKDAPWLPEFLDEIRAFPSGRHDDQVDALSQLMTAIRGRMLPGGGGGDSDVQFKPWMYGEVITSSYHGMPEPYDELGWRRVDDDPDWDGE